MIATRFQHWMIDPQELRRNAELLLTVARGDALNTLHSNRLYTMLASLLLRLAVRYPGERYCKMIIVEDCRYADEIVAKTCNLLVERIANSHDPLRLLSLDIESGGLSDEEILEDVSVSSTWTEWNQQLQSEIDAVVQMISKDDNLRIICLIALRLGSWFRETWLIEASIIWQAKYGVTQIDRSESSSIAYQCLFELFSLGVLRRTRVLPLVPGKVTSPVISEDIFRQDYELTFISKTMRECVFKAINAADTALNDVFRELGDLLLSKAGDVERVASPHAVGDLFKNVSTQNLQNADMIAQILLKAGVIASKSGAPNEGARRLKKALALVAKRTSENILLAADIIAELIRTVAASDEFMFLNDEQRRERAAEYRRDAETLMDRMSSPHHSAAKFRIIRGLWNMYQNWCPVDDIELILTRVSEITRSLSGSKSSMPIELEACHMKAVTYFAKGSFANALEAANAGREICRQIADFAEIRPSVDLFGSHDGAICCKCIGSLSSLIIFGANSSPSPADMTRLATSNHLDECNNAEQWFDDASRYVQSKNNDISARPIFANYACLFWCLKGNAARARSIIASTEDWQADLDLLWICERELLLWITEIEELLPFGRPWLKRGDSTAIGSECIKHSRARLMKRRYDEMFYVSAACEASYIFLRGDGDIEERASESSKTLSDAITLCVSVGDTFFLAELYRRRAAMRALFDMNSAKEDLKSCRNIASKQNAMLWLDNLCEDEKYYESCGSNE